MADPKLVDVRPAGREALILAPGMLCDAGAWSAQVAALSDVADCLIPDYGDARSMAAMAARVLADAPPRFSIAGHSMGGRVALEVCRLAPQRVARLCLLSTEHLAPPPGEAGRREAAGRQALADIARAQGMRAVAEHWLPHLLPEARRQDPPLVDAIVSMIERQTPEMLDAQIAAGLSRPDSAAVLRALRCPLLIMGGEADAIRPPAAQRAMAALAPSARLRILGGCGHMITLERPGDVAQEMAAWLSL